MKLFELAKAELIRSNVDRRHPFRYCVLSTFGAYPESRTIVKRKVDTDLSILLFTDARSPKVSHIQENPKVSVLFYHSKKKLQIRVKGEAILMDENRSTYNSYFEQIKSSKGIADYTTLEAPGSQLTNETNALFGEKIHFLIIKIIPQYLDILQLGLESHERYGYKKMNKEWIEVKLVP